jgi:hypothetical protein
MLLTNRRLGLIYFCLAGMEVAWFTPFFLLFYRSVNEISPFGIFFGLFGVLLAFLLTLEILNLFQVDWPYYELAVIGLIILSSLIFVRLWLYIGMPLGDFHWLGNTLGALFDFQQGIRPELVLILTSVLLWQRATSATSRDMGFFGVGFSFRLGLLLLIIGATVSSIVTGRDARPILWVYLGLGLTAVALARAREKAFGTRSAGSFPSPRRFGQLLLAVGITVGVAIWLSLLYTPESIKRLLLFLLKPLWTLLSPLLVLLLRGLFWLLSPVFLWLDWLLRRLAESLDWSFVQEFLDNANLDSGAQQFAEQSEGVFAGVPPWVWTGLRFILILVVIAAVLGFVLIFLDRMRVRRDQDEVEGESGERVTMGGSTLGRGVRWLRDMAGLVRRFGLSRQLLAAISVQNIYANLCRLARQRGYPRHPAQPPDDYLPDMAQAFDGQEEALARITAAYMQVHYGDQPVSVAELAQLRQDYQEIRKDG